jgi:hypothetical protein
LENNTEKFNLIRISLPPLQICLDEKIQQRIFINSLPAGSLKATFAKLALAENGQKDYTSLAKALEPYGFNCLYREFTNEGYWLVMFPQQVVESLGLRFSSGLIETKNAIFYASVSSIKDISAEEFFLNSDNHPAFLRLSCPIHFRVELSKFGCQQFLKNYRHANIFEKLLDG